MEKKNNIIGKIIDIRVEERDTSTVVNTNKLTLKETIKRIEGLYQFEKDKSEMASLIKEVKDKWDE